MTNLLHRLTHRVPGVPDHRDEPHPRARSPRLQGRSPRLTDLGQRLNHTAGRPPRVLAGWQRRIAALLGRPLQ